MRRVRATDTRVYKAHRTPCQQFREQTSNPGVTYQTHVCERSEVTLSVDSTVEQRTLFSRIFYFASYFQ